MGFFLSNNCRCFRASGAQSGDTRRPIRRLRSLIAITCLLTAGAAWIAPRSDATTACVSSKVAVTKVVPVVRNGKVLKRKGKVVTHRIVVKVKRRERVKIHGKIETVTRMMIKYRTITVCPPQTTPAAIISNGIYYMPGLPETVSRPGLLEYQISYDASAWEGTTELDGLQAPLPIGTLGLYVNGTLECSARIGSVSGTGSECFVNFPSLGNYELETEYLPDGGTATWSSTMFGIGPVQTDTFVGFAVTSRSSQSCGSNCTEMISQFQLSSSTRSEPGVEHTGTTTFSVSLVGTPIAENIGTCSSLVLTTEVTSGTPDSFEVSLVACGASLGSDNVESSGLTVVASYPGSTDDQPSCSSYTDPYINES